MAHNYFSRIMPLYSLFLNFTTLKHVFNSQNFGGSLWNLYYILLYLVCPLSFLLFFISYLLTPPSHDSISATKIVPSSLTSLSLPQVSLLHYQHAL